MKISTIIPQEKAAGFIKKFMKLADDDRKSREGCARTKTISAYNDLSKVIKLFNPETKRSNSILVKSISSFARTREEVFI